MADENVRFQIENKIIEIIQQYYDLANRENIYSTFKTSYQISLDRYNQALEKYNSGALTKLNLLNAEVNLNQDKVNMEEAKIAAKSSKLNMSLILGIADESYYIQADFIFNYNLNIDDLLNKLNTNNSSIIIAQLNYAIAQDELKLSKSNFAPTIDLFSSYSYDNIQSETSFISKQNNYGVIAGINIEIPIFSANMKRKNYQNAKINLTSKNHSLEQIKATIKTALLKAYYSYTEGLKNLELLKTNLETIEKSANISKELYDVGQISFDFDKELRKKYPALQDALEHYQSVRKMCETREKEESDD